MSGHIRPVCLGDLWVMGAIANKCVASCVSVQIGNTCLCWADLLRVRGMTTNQIWTSTGREELRRCGHALDEHAFPDWRTIFGL
jgi:hypothetical protein